MGVEIQRRTRRLRTKRRGELAFPASELHHHHRLPHPVRLHENPAHTHLIALLETMPSHTPDADLKLVYPPSFIPASVTQQLPSGLHVRRLSSPAASIAPPTVSHKYSSYMMPFLGTLFCLTTHVPSPVLDGSSSDPCRRPTTSEVTSRYSPFSPSLPT
jgi:hypothetical protein